MEGSLLKWTNFLSGWQNRFFVLKGPILSYYLDKTANLPKGRIYLPISTIIEAPESDYEFQIDTGSTIYYLKTETKEEKVKWLSIIKLNKLESEKQFLNLTKNDEICASLQKLTEKYQNNQEIVNSLNTIIIKINPSYTPIKQEIIKSKGGNKFKINDMEEVDIVKHENEVFFSQENDEENTSNIRKVITNQINNIKTTPNSFYDPLYNYQRRTCLPSKIKKLSYNVWDLLKGAIGRDINRFCLPVFLNEPLSMLQKLCENFQYAAVLNEASKEPNPYLRLAYCACFCIGGFTMNTKRAKKFFNPLLFETFEYIDNTLNYRYFAEQVSHHPAISACYAEGDGWKFFTNNNAIIKFMLTGKMEVNNVGRCYVHFHRFNDNIVFTKPLCVIRNLIIGTIVIDMVGKFVVNNANGDHCEVDMIPSTTGEQGNLTGVVKDIYGNVKLKIEGNWLKEIKVIDTETKSEKVLWKLIPSESEDNYYFQPYSFDLNNLTEEMKSNLPRTDSRFRPDQRLMEYQDIDNAGDEKHRLEEKQRKTRKENEKNGIIPKPMYFDETYDDLTGELIYRYKGTYFEDRKNKNFAHFPDIFSNN